MLTKSYKSLKGSAMCNVSILFCWFWYFAFFLFWWVGWLVWEGVFGCLVAWLSLEDVLG